MTDYRQYSADNSLNELFEMLSHGVRRRTLIAIGRKNPRDEDELTSESLADEDASDEELDVLTKELYHTHLPKLADAGFINWDPDDGVVTRGPRFEDIAPLLNLMSDHQDELPDDWP